MQLRFILVFTGVLSWTFGNIWLVFHYEGLSMFWPSVCDFKDTGCLNMGHTLVQSLADRVCHIPKHSWVMRNRYQKLGTTVCGSTTFAPADPVCRPKSIFAGISSSSTVNWCRYHPRRRSPNQSYSLMKAVFTWVDESNMCGMERRLLYISNPQTPSSLAGISSRCAMISHNTCTHRALAPWGEISQQWLMQK